MPLGAGGRDLWRGDGGNSILDLLGEERVDVVSSSALRFLDGGGGWLGI